MRAACLVLLGLVAAVAGKPHIIMVLQDDLGWYDTGIHGGPSAAYTRNITKLASDGILLTSHYVHWHCSPTRRSFLTGRLPIHHGEQLSDVATDDIDLRMTWISAKLKQAGYLTHFYGKGHTGYKSMRHLPTSNGFDRFFGYLPGAQSYTSNMRWEGEHPAHNDSQIAGGLPCPSCHVTSYSTELYGEYALQAVREHPADEPMFMYLAFQAVHTPYDPVPGNPFSSTYHAMIWDADVFLGRLRAALEDRGMWGDTLLVYSSDNGGVEDGINYPLRGEKHSNWEGGIRVSAFVSGGWVPPALRGTSNAINFHIVDWYPTFCSLAGVDARDDPPVPPLPVDKDRPHKDIYGEQSYPPLDGTNIAPMLLQPSAYNKSSAHQYLVVSKEVVIAGNYKLLVAQPHFKTQNNGWKSANGTWIPPTKPYPCTAQDAKGVFPSSGYSPCLFNVADDMGEHEDLAPSMPQLVEELWGVLNLTVLTTRDCSGWSGPIPGPSGQCSPPDLLGKCDSACANKHWATAYPTNGVGAAAGVGPVCDVPSC